MIFMKRTAILGIGNISRGDDYAGPLTVEHLLNMPKVQKDSILIINCENVPENFIFKVIEFNPELVIFIDAAEMGKKPGEIQELPRGQVDDLTTSTHPLSLSVLMNMISVQISTTFMVFGIQPGNTELNAEVTREVKDAVSELALRIISIIEKD